MADLTTEGIIPNMSLFADYQLVPLQHVDINNQAGPAPMGHAVHGSFGLVHFRADSSPRSKPPG